MVYINVFWFLDMSPNSLGLFAFLFERFLRRLDLLDLVDETVLDLVADELHARPHGSVLETRVRQLHRRVFFSNRSLQILDVVFEASDLFFGLFFVCLRIEYKFEIQFCFVMFYFQMKCFVRLEITFFFCHSSSSRACSVS